MLSTLTLVATSLLLRSTRGFTNSVGSTTTTTTSCASSLASFDFNLESKLPWQQDGYNSWKWRGNDINYVDVGAPREGEPNKPKLLLIHGFGASVFHWRYNIPVLARKYHVFAIDMLGFGLSDKPIVDYSSDLWRDQVLDFLQEVVNPANAEDSACVVAGNSLGGFTALAAAADERSVRLNLVNGCILLNAAGRFKSPDANAVVEKEKPAWIQAISAAFQRFVISLSFYYTKQPARIAQVLRQVYPVDPSNVDDELVASIQFPSRDPNAAEVFYRVIAKNGNGPPVTVNELLERLKLPLLLLWGVQDPWIRPAAADKIQALYPRATRVDVNAGHCPHDEVPDQVNAAIDAFMQNMQSVQNVQSVSTVPT